MSDRGATVAVWVALLVVLAGIVVLIPAEPPSQETDLHPDVEDNQLAVDDGTPAGSFSGPATSSAQYELYRALSTYLPPSHGEVTRSRSDRRSGESRASDQRLHRWRCPICDATKLSLGTPNGDPGEEAANNLRSHVRNSNGDGHGPPGTLPASVTPELIRASVVVSELAER